MPVYYRNKRTGEIKEVTPDTPEVLDLQAQRDPYDTALPLWEQTSLNHAAAIKERAKFGELEDHEVGRDHQEELRRREVALATEGVGPELAPHLNLTPGEIEAGLTPEQKAEELKDMYGTSPAHRQEVIDEASDAIADEREQRPAAAQAQGLRARAGGSDDRSDPPESPSKRSGKAKAASGSSSGSSGSSPGSEA